MCNTFFPFTLMTLWSWLVAAMSYIQGLRRTLKAHILSSLIFNQYPASAAKVGPLYLFQVQQRHILEQLHPYLQSRIFEVQRGYLRVSRKEAIGVDVVEQRRSRMTPAASGPRNTAAAASAPQPPTGAATQGGGTAEIFITALQWAQD